jgi:ABC-type protease/lipase transport system fused ATPase/permease subunit
VLVLANGRAQAFGPKNEVMQKVLDPAASAAVARGAVLKAEVRAG